MFTPLERTMKTASTLPAKLDRKARQVTKSLSEKATRLAEQPDGSQEDRMDLAREAELRQRRERTLLVEPHLGGWAIVEQGTGEIQRIVSSREIAYLEARRLAQREDRRLILHTEGGEIRRILCYS